MKHDKIKKHPFQNNLTEINKYIFQNKVLKFLVANSLSFRSVENKSFRKLLQYLRRYMVFNFKIYNNIIIIFGSFCFLPFEKKDYWLLKFSKFYFKIYIHLFRLNCFKMGVF